MLSAPDVVGKGAWSVVKRCSVIPPYVPKAVEQSSVLLRGSRCQYVVKIIEKDYLISLTSGDVERAMAEVKREIEVLKHIPPQKHVVNFIEEFETDHQFLLIFEDVQCGDLCELILKSPGAKLEEERAKKYTYQLIQAVLHCHVNDVIHRDIKPENLLVNESDDLKLTDFGLAKWAKGGGAAASSPPSSSSSAPSVGATRWLVAFPGAEKLEGRRIVCSDVIGTPRYGAPEMFYAKFSQTQYDGYKADTWSVGIVAFILLSGAFPFFSGPGATEQETFKSILETPLSVPKEVSSEAADFLKRILHKDPQKRLSLADALDHPWMEKVAIKPIYTSETIDKHRLQGTTNVATILSDCAAEIDQLHLTIAKLRREVLTHRLKSADAANAAAGAKKIGVVGGKESLASSLRRAETPTGSRARTGASPAPTSARLGVSPMRPGSATARSAVGTVRTSSPSVIPDRTVSRGGSTTQQQPAAVVRPASATGGAGVRTASPLSRSSPSTQRRGTPLRPTGVNGVSPATAAPPVAGGKPRTATPGATSRVSSSNGIRPSSAGPATAAGTAGASSSSSAFGVGDAVIYKSCRAVVQFSGPTTFGAGTWVGLEMLEGNEGSNDGSSVFDKRRYFTCPKGKGVFVRASQIKRADGENGAAGDL
ncbi:protein kinase, putative [Bodo saltans]|uniref:Protein kinase, putative n=1 Tax=Bodo saltans TaxID=75058 RepID=A0A0S4IX25_BODSA|nr:protein kinase, putative [Bodo saltans]|eukprot:CUG02083.1 protein kinase, putative [Bodo saltans]